MRTPRLEGRLARRILLNYRVEPSRLAPLLPAPLRPLVWRGWGVAGVCLIRLQALRPAGLPAWVGFASESAAHRVAVAWEDGGCARTGVYVLRRDTDALAPRLLGSRLFPGRFDRAKFEAETTPDRWRLQMEAPELRVDLRATRANHLSKGSIFRDLHEASVFFQSGALGWSEGRQGLEGMALELEGWNLQPLEVGHAQASFFEDRQRFPTGSLELDSAFLMEELPLRWVDAGHLTLNEEASCVC